MTPEKNNVDDKKIDDVTAADETTGSDPFHDFTVPQDADFVAAPTPNVETDDDSADDNDPLGENN